MALVLTVETSFGGNEMQLARVADYLNAISPCIEKQPAAFPLFAESLTITTVALHEHFLASLVAGAAHHSQPVLRKYFAKDGNDNERKIAADCDLGTIIRLLLLRDALVGMKAQADYLRQRLFEQGQWQQKAKHGA